MKTYAFLSMLFLAGVGCYGVEPTTEDKIVEVNHQSDQECVGAKNGAPCDGGSFTSGSCNAGVCVQYNDCKLMADGDVCGGAETDVYYGRCADGLCAWKDYQCLGRPKGEACVVSGDINGTCNADECCTFCIDAQGQCKIVHDANDDVISGGVACP